MTMALGMPELKRSWLQYWTQDLRQTPGRLERSLRLALTSVLVLIVMMALQIPYHIYGLYLILIVGYETPPLSLRTGIASLLGIACSLSTALIVVILTDNNPIARIMSLAAVTFVAGMITVATSLPALGPTVGLIFGVGIGFWENHAPADKLVKNSLWLLAAHATGIAGAIAVGYVFGSGSPADKLAEQLRTRYRALEQMFKAYASDSLLEERRAAAEQVSRLAAAGQREMLQLSNQIVDGNLARGGLPTGVHVQIPLLAELLDCSAGFGLQSDSSEPELQSRCETIARQCGHLANELKPDPELKVRSSGPMVPTHLDRVEAILRSLHTIPSDPTRPGLVPLPSPQLHFMIPGAIWKTENITFALKVSFCATICYIAYHAVAWPGISTAVTTVMVAGLVDTGAMKQKLVFRLLGGILGGLVLGLGAEVFLFPFMDSITSLVVVIGTVVFLCVWVAGGPRLNYVGLQMAFAFYITSLAGFSAPAELAPARDRFVGIMLAVLVMWLVFDQVWPVRSVKAMRRVAASILKDASCVIALIDSRLLLADYIKDTDGLRNRLRQELVTVRTLNEATQYEFGVAREKQMHTAGTLMQISMTAVALVWNHAELLHRRDEGPYPSPPELVRLRQALAERLSSIADALDQEGSLDQNSLLDTVDLESTAAKSESEYARNTIARFRELQVLALSLESTD
jgi:multidrug resistance protein MdtO